MKEKKIKVCFAASSGGHFEQLMMLKPLMLKYDSFIVTEKTEYYSKIDDVKTYNVIQVNRREFSFFINMIINSIVSLYILFKEKPNFIITTGVLAIIPICLLGKILGVKIVYIESFAKVTSPTLTGKLLHKFSNQFYVQWSEMLDIFPEAIYKGGIY